MEKVKANYFNGIRGENEAINNITTDLSPFQEVYEENGELVWVRDVKDMKGYGIVPTPIEGWGGTGGLAAVQIQQPQCHQPREPVGYPAGRTQERRHHQLSVQRSGWVNMVNSTRLIP